MSSRVDAPLNQILFGPPGTGKTYSTIDRTLEILDPELVATTADRTERKRRFDELLKQERVRFVTFHQSFSYEDFVEGLRAVSDEEKGLSYVVEAGVFKRLCDDARVSAVQPAWSVRSHPRIWKISIDGTGVTPSKTYCLGHDEARIGWGQTGDLKLDLETNDYYKSLGKGDKGTLRYFAEEVSVGDILLCIHSADEIGAVGVVTGEYSFQQEPPTGVHKDYKHVRPVKWLYRDLELPIQPLNDNRQFTLKTVYAMDRLTWGDLLSYLEKSECKPIAAELPSTARKPFVLVIDEINRGNVSRIFGELITLIETSKREGAAEALSVDLPYSKKPFSVPDNVYLVGTMNTADRSLSGMDIALRRRFVFREMLPRASLLEGVHVGELAIDQMLEVMNARIEALLDRDHCLGHAYFMALREDPSLDRLALIFRNQVMPLLQEYFFEDWQRIQWVLNDHRKPEAKGGGDRFVFQRGQDLDALFGQDVNVAGHQLPWCINDDAFDRLEAYLGIVDHKVIASPTAVLRWADHDGFQIRQLASETIEVFKDGIRIEPARPVLRSAAQDLGVPLTYGTGRELNTRALGKAILDQLSKATAA
jgi:5-methylcytosine-specific restriction enzyme B